MFIFVPLVPMEILLLLGEALDSGMQVVARNVCPRPNKEKLYHFGNLSDFVS